MKKNRLNQCFLVILIFIIAVSCYSVVVFAKINDDVVDMDELNKFTTPQNTTQEDKTVVPGSRGDINKDGYINIRDLVMLKRRLASYIDIIIVEEACDINNDKIIDIRDAVLLSKHLAGIDINLDGTEEATNGTVIATPIEPTFPSVATPIEIPTSEHVTIPEPTSVDQEVPTTHPDPDGPGWSDWITL